MYVPFVYLQILQDQVQGTDVDEVQAAVHPISIKVQDSHGIAKAIEVKRKLCLFYLNCLLIA